MNRGMLYEQEDEDVADIKSVEAYTCIFDCLRIQ